MMAKALTIDHSRLLFVVFGSAIFKCNAGIDPPQKSPVVSVVNGWTTIWLPSTQFSFKVILMTDCQPSKVLLGPQSPIMRRFVGVMNKSKSRPASLH